MLIFKVLLGGKKKTCALFIWGQMFCTALKKSKVPLNAFISNANYLGMLGILLHE